MIKKDSTNYIVSIKDGTCSSKIWADRLIYYCMAGLLLILPIAHTTTIRAFLILFPAVLWLFTMYKNNRPGLVRTPLDIPLALYLLTILLSLFTSLKLSVSINELRGEFLTYSILFYLVVCNIRREERVFVLVNIMLFGSFIMAVYAAIDFFNHGHNLLTFQYRTGSFHQGYEAYAQYIIIIIPFLVMFIVYVKNTWLRVISLMVFFLNIFALYLTHTRGAWIAFWCESFLMSFVLLKKGLIRIVVIVAMVVIPVVAVEILPEQVIWHGKKGIDIELKRDMNTVETRLLVWKNTVKGLVKHPFMPAGYGKANFKRRFRDKEFLGFEQAHNTFLNTATQLGLQGLFALLFIIYAILRANLVACRSARSEFRKLFAFATIVMTIGFFMANQFAEFYIDDTALLFWLLIGFSISLAGKASFSENDAGY